MEARNGLALIHLEGVLDLLVCLVLGYLEVLARVFLEKVIEALVDLVGNGFVVSFLSKRPVLVLEVLSVDFLRKGLFELPHQPENQLHLLLVVFREIGPDIFEIQVHVFLLFLQLSCDSRQGFLD